MPEPPTRAAMLKELYAVQDLISLFYPRIKRIYPEYCKNSKHIVMFPGFGADKRYFKPLSLFLKRHGHHIYDWGLGTNDAGLKRNFALSDVDDSWQADANGKAKPINTNEMGVPYLCSRATQRVRSLSESIDAPIVVLGWSLGGTIAREVARELPEHVCQVITFGTPTVGGPKYTATASTFAKQNMDLDWIEKEILKRDARPITQAITAIRGRFDGIVPSVTISDNISPKVTEFEVNSTHMGMAFHYPLWLLLLKTLA